jgi:hypothetical protein
MVPSRRKRYATFSRRSPSNVNCVPPMTFTLYFTAAREKKSRYRGVSSARARTESAGRRPSSMPRSWLVSSSGKSAKSALLWAAVSTKKEHCFSNSSQVSIQCIRYWTAQSRTFETRYHLWGRSGT